jgi:acyl-homoserine-lactone acylase
MRTWLVFGLLLSAGWCCAQPAALPDDPWADASVYRDEWGVPHVRAGSLQHAAFAFGYAQAQDQLENLLRAYRMANGRAAEVWGEGYAPYDALALQLQHGDLAKAAFDTLPQSARDLCLGFAKGVNTWMVEHPETLPDWAEGVSPHDPLALLHFFIMAQARLDLREPAVLAPVAETGNAWAVTAAKGADGHAILVANPHTYYTGPFQWYEAHLTTPQYDVYGATLCGLPLILLGHNGAMAWSLTPNRADFADVYIDPAPSLHAQPGSVNQMNVPPPALLLEYLGGDIRQYLVKTASGFEKRHIPVAMREEGPIIAFQGGRALIWRAAGYGDFTALQQLLEMGQAQDVESFLSVMAQRHLPCFHVVCADKTGEIAYLYNTSAPAGRAAGREATDLLQPLEPSLWQGISPTPVPFDQLPLIRMPASGFVQACGNPPEGATTGAEAVAVLPAGIVLDRDTYRARRARQLLEAPVLSFHDAHAMLFDTYASLAAELLPLMQPLGEEAQRLHPDAGALLALLAQWDGRATVSSTAMTAFHVWWIHFAARAQNGDPNTFYTMLREGDDRLRPSMLAALVDAARALRNDFGTLEVPWGEAHLLQRGDRIEPVGGALSGEPLFLMSDVHSGPKHWQALYGSAFAMVVEWSDPPRTTSIVPFGASENPDSPHFDDQMELFLDSRMKPAWFSAAAVQRQTVEARGKTLFFAPPGWAGEIAVVASQPITVTVTTALTPPVPLPAGLATFSVYASLSWTPADTPVMAYVTASATGLGVPQPGAAQVWVYIKDQWQPLIAPGEASAREITEGTATFALLGPEEARQNAAFDASPAPRVETTAETNPTVLVPAIPSVAQEPPLAAPAQTDLDAAPQTVLIPARPSDSDTLAVEPAPTASGPELATPDLPPAKERVVITEIPEDVAVQDRPPARERHLTKEALKQMQWGTQLVLQTPWGVICTITAPERLGARLIQQVPDDQAAPAGLAAYSPGVTIEHTAETDASVDVAVSIPVAADVCSAEALRKAALYAFTPEEGWRQVAGQRLNVSTRTFSALDTHMRTYAILGPTEGRSKAPAAPQ